MNIKTETQKRRVSIQRMGRIWQYLVHYFGYTKVVEQGLTMGDFDGLSFEAMTFAQFLAVNRSGIQLYDDPEEGDRAIPS